MGLRDNLRISSADQLICSMVDCVPFSIGERGRPGQQFSFFMNPFSIGFPAWLLCAAISYFLREKAIGQLSAEQIGQITLAQRPARIRLLIGYLGIFLGFLVLRFGFPSLTNSWFLLFLSLITAVTALFTAIGVRLTRVIAPVHPARLLVYANVIGFLGLLSLLGAMATTVFLD